MNSADTRATRWVNLLLVLTSLAVYCQVGTFEFVNYDDEWIITENPYIRDGLTRDGIVWAFTDSKFDWWHPLTWLSHMTDIELFGMRSGMHHLTNVWLHLANTLLLFAVLKRMTGAVWQSGIVAALFALHPLHVESVAWVTERKDVLSTLFWLLTMLAYCRYVEKPGRVRYGVVVLAFVCGLMAKPMLVTLPFVLLLLDWWPLNRLRAVPISRLIWEKLPLFALAVISSVLTVIGQQQVSGVPDTTLYPVLPRLGNALISYVVYLRKMVWPSDLAVFYPFPTSLPVWQVVGAFVLLLAVTMWVLRLRREHPYLSVGWFWYLGTLLPVIGLVQVGDRAMADRFTYVPLIGIFVMFAWGLPAVAASRRTLLAAVAITASIAAVVTTLFQVRTWQNSVTLFEHAVRVVPRNHVAHNNLGTALAVRGRTDEAAEQFQIALQYSPRYAPGLHNLGLAFELKGKTNEAFALYTAALDADPNYGLAHYNLGVLFIQRRELDAAVRHLSEAVRLRPYYAPAHFQLGTALAGQGKNPAAIGHYLAAVQLQPDNAKAHYHLGILLAGEGKLDLAILHYQAAILITPDYPEAHNNLGLALVTAGRGAEAIREYREAIRARPDYEKAHFNLGLALAEQGNVKEAIAQFEETARIAASKGNADLARKATAQAQRYAAPPPK